MSKIHKMYSYNFLLVAIFSIIYISCENCDKLGVLLYEDLGCVPQKTDEKPCPIQFQCYDFTASNQACTFHSKNISVGENLDDSLINSAAACKIGCQCILPDELNIAEFNCATQECPEDVEVGEDLKPNCYRTYDVGECCASGIKCPPLSGVKCIIDGNEYREGEQFFPSTDCSSCVCRKGFKNVFEAPFCKRMVCAEQTMNYEKLVENCAPVYLEEEIALCCPEEWICPSDVDNFTLLRAESNLNNSDLECKWGKEVLKLGIGFEAHFTQDGEDKNITCKCVLPPLLTCKEEDTTPQTYFNDTTVKNGKCKVGASQLRLEIVLFMLLAIIATINLY